jgi:hypothetical protein
MSADLEAPSVCVTCHVRVSADGCRQCDVCMDEANRLWQCALHTRRERVHAAEVLRKAERAELDALIAFNAANSTQDGPLSQRAPLRVV